MPSSIADGLQMTSQEYRQIRETIGLSQAKIAAYLGVTERTIQCREHGKMAIDREAELALHCLQAFHGFGKIFNNQ